MCSTTFCSPKTNAKSGNIPGFYRPESSLIMLFNLFYSTYPMMPSIVSAEIMFTAVEPDAST